MATGWRAGTEIGISLRGDPVLLQCGLGHLCVQYRTVPPEFEKKKKRIKRRNKIMKIEIEVDRDGYIRDSGSQKLVTYKM